MLCPKFMSGLIKQESRTAPCVDFDPIRPFTLGGVVLGQWVLEQLRQDA